MKLGIRSIPLVEAEILTWTKEFCYISIMAQTENYEKNDAIARFERRFMVLLISGSNNRANAPYPMMPFLQKNSRENPLQIIDIILQSDKLITPYCRLRSKIRNKIHCLKEVGALY